jgi:hypothetical protein
MALYTITTLSSKPYRLLTDYSKKRLYPLALLVAMDYERRRKRERPDKWHWADELLVREGYFVQRVD